MSVAIGSVAAGQTVTGQTVTGGTITAKGVTFKDCTFVGQHIIKASANMNLLIDGGTKANDNSVTPTTYEGQFQIDGNGVNWGTGRSGIIFRKFTSVGGTGDGIQVGAVRGLLIEDCEFYGHEQNSTIHADAVQIMASQFVTFSGVWFHNNASSIMMVDWDNSDNAVIDCLFTNGKGWECCMSGVPRVRFEHNTIYKPVYGVRIQDDHSGNPASTGYSVRYNAYPSGFAPNLNSGSGTSTPNLTGAVYKTPADPGTRAGFSLANPTLAPDGDVWGSRRLGTPPTPPPADKTPVAAFTFKPMAPVAGQAVTFDAASSDPGDPPASYTWTDEPSGGQVYPLGTGSPLVFTFQGVGTKYVNLVVKDADGDTSRVEHDVTVAAAPPTPPPLAVGDTVKVTDSASMYYAQTGKVTAIGSGTVTVQFVPVQFPTASVAKV